MTNIEPPDVPGNPAGFIRSLQAAGEGPTAGLQIFRDAGGHIANDRWFGLYRQVADTLAGTPQTLGLDPSSLPGPGEYETWQLGPGNQYMTQVNVTLYDRDLADAGVEDPFLIKPYTYVTDEPHTIEEAEDDALSQFDPENTGSDFNQVAMGALATTVARTVARG